MSDNYSIKFNNGATSFEVQGPNETWVDTKVSELKELMETMPVPHLAPVGSGAAGPAKRTAKKTTPKATSSQKNTDSKSQLEDKWTDDLEGEVLAFIAERQGGFDKGATKQAAILAVYLKDNEGINAINSQDLEFIYRKLSLPTISHPNQLNNAVNRDKYFDKTSAGYELVHAGTRFGRDISKTIAKDKK